VFGLKRSTAGAFVSTFLGIEPKKYDRRSSVLLELVPQSSEKISSHAHKEGSRYLLRVIFKLYDEHPCPFHMGVPPQPTLKSPNIGTSHCMVLFVVSIAQYVFKRELYVLFTMAATPFTYNRVVGLGKVSCMYNLLHRGKQNSRYLYSINHLLVTTP